MIKNIAISVLTCAVIGLGVYSYLLQKENADVKLKLHNTELNLQYEKGLE
jgi:hypothetical protein